MDVYEPRPGRGVGWDMTASTALVRVARRRPAPGVAALRRALIERAMDEAMVAPRVWLEALEPRRMFDAGLAALHLDSRFGDGGYAELPTPTPKSWWVAFSALTAAPDGSIYVAGVVDEPDSEGTLSQVKVIARLQANGRLDTSFANGGELIPPGDGTVQGGSMLVQPDGKLIVLTYEGQAAAIYRFNTDGSSDPTFGNDGVARTGYIMPGQAWLAADGTIHVVTAEEFNESVDVATVTLRSDGTPVALAGSAGPWNSAPIFSGTPSIQYGAAIGYLESAVPLPDGGAVAYVTVGPRVPATGEVSSWDLYQVRIDGAGEVTSSREVFHSTPEDAYLYAEVAPDGSAFVFGVSGMFRVPLESGVATPYPTAAPLSAGSRNLGADSVIFQSDGKIVLTVGDEAISGLWRFASDGVPDATFAGGEPAFGDARFLPGGALPTTGGIALRDGSLLVGLDPPVDGGSVGVAKVWPDGGKPDAFVPPVAEPDDPASGSQSLTAPPADGSASAAAVPPAGDIVPSSDVDRGLFAAPSGFTIWNPDGTRAVFDDAPLLN